MRSTRDISIARAVLSLTALLLALSGSCRHSQPASASPSQSLPEAWKPEWKVGDWWVLKFRVRGLRSSATTNSSPDSIWRLPPVRVLFEVTGIKRVNGRNCYAIRTRRLPLPERLPWAKYTHYLRCDSLWLVRIAVSSMSNRDSGTVQTKNRDFGEGHRGPSAGQLTWMGNLPAFPLRTAGAEAEALRRVHGYPLVGQASQSVTTGQVRDFANAARALDMPSLEDSECFRVHLQYYGIDSTHSLSPFSASDELWAPHLPWLLYAEDLGPPKQPGNPVVQRWLADYSCWHPKDARPDTVEE